LAGQHAALQALQSALSTAYPSFTINIDINPNVVQNRYEAGTFTLETLAEWARQKSIAIIGGDKYLGVAIAPFGTTIDVYDNGIEPPASKHPKVIAFQDMIGQPVFLNYPQIS
jgi:hypothetical protein